MNRVWQRIRLTWLGLSHISFGTAVLIIAVTERERTIWSLPEYVFGGVMFTAGVVYLLEEVRQARARPPAAPVPQPNGQVQVGIPLAPAERGDPELAVEGLLLQHDPPRIWVPLGNVGVVVHNPPVLENDRGRVDIRLAPVEQGDPELAMVGFVLHNPPQALNRNDEAGIGQAEGIDERQVQVVANNAAVRVGIRLAPAEQGDLEVAMLGLVIHAPPLVFDRRERVVGIEQGVHNDVGQAQAAEVNGSLQVGVGIRLGLPAIGDPSMVKGLSQDPPQIHAPVGDLRKCDADHPPNREQEKALMVEDEQSITECGEEDSPAVCVVLDDAGPAVLLADVPLNDVSNVGQLCDRGQAQPLEDAMQARSQDVEVKDVLQAEVMGGPVQAEVMGEPVQAVVMGEPVQAVVMDEPVQITLLGDTEKSASMDKIGEARPESDARQLLKSEASSNPSGKSSSKVRPTDYVEKSIERDPETSAEGIVEQFTVEF